MISLQEKNQINNQLKQNRILPIYHQSKEIQIVAMNDKIGNGFIDYMKKGKEKTTSLLQQAMEEAESLSKEDNGKTQREIIQENKQNPWRLEIPKIGLNVHIKEGTSSNVLLKSVGLFENSSKWNGNVCLAGHNRGYQCNFFQKIKNLKVGDTIIYHTTKGKKVYQVQVNKIILETDWSHVQQTKDNRITLITCEENRREYRRCIQAVQIAET